MARPAVARPADAVAKARSPRISKPSPEQETVESALPNLDRIIHERMRLGIVSALAVNESLTFNELKRLLQTTDGNLSVHARRIPRARARRSRDAANAPPKETTSRRPNLSPAFHKMPSTAAFALG